jgi:hypothetical protein
VLSEVCRADQFFFHKQASISALSPPLHLFNNIATTLYPAFKPARNSYRARKISKRRPTNIPNPSATQS